MRRSLRIVFPVVALSLATNARPSPAELPIETPGILWSAESGVSVGEPTYTEGAVYYGDDLGVVRALDAATGEERWRHETKSRITESPAIDGERVFVTNGFGVVAMDRTSGERLWAAAIEHGAGETLPIVAGGQVLAAGYDGKVHAFEPATGQPLWEQEFVSDAPPDPEGFSGERARFGNADARPTGAAATDSLYVLNVFDQSRVVAFDISPEGRGRIVWSYPVGGWTGDSPLFVGDAVYAVSQSKRIACLDLATGQERWRQQGPTWLAARPGHFDGTLYVPVHDGRILTFDAATGEPGQTLAAPDGDGHIYTDPLLTERAIYFPLSRSGRLVALDRTSGELIWDLGFSAGTELYTPLRTDGSRIFVSSRGGEGRGQNAIHAVGIE